jgi:membrane protease YdiL (CAAX protease family)
MPRRIGAIVFTVLGVLLLGFALRRLFDGQTSLLDSTVGTGIALASISFLAAYLYAIPPQTPPTNALQRIAPLILMLIFILVPGLVGTIIDQVGGGVALSTVISQAITAAILFWLWHSTGRGIGSFMGPLPATPGQWLWLLTAVPLILLSLGELILVHNLALTLTPQPTLQALGAAAEEGSAVQLIGNPLGLFAVVVSGPLVEELIFRGSLIPFWRERRTLLTTLLASSLLFFLIHLDITSPFSTMMLGVICGIAYLRTGSLLLPIGIHIIHNLLGFVVTVAPQFTMVTAEQVRGLLVVGIGCTVVAAVLLGLIVARRAGTRWQTVAS